MHAYPEDLIFENEEDKKKDTEHIQSIKDKEQQIFQIEGGLQEKEKLLEAIKESQKKM